MGRFCWSLDTFSGDAAIRVASISSRFVSEDLHQTEKVYLQAVPAIDSAELREKYKDLGLTIALSGWAAARSAPVSELGEMTEFEQGDDWGIEPAVYEAARYVALQLMAKDIPPPRLFNHGPKSVVFNWTSNNSGMALYLTVSADKVSALISSPARIQRRMEIDYSKLPNTIYALSASVEGGVDRQIVMLVVDTTSEPALLG